MLLLLLPTDFVCVFVFVVVHSSVCLYVVCYCVTVYVRPCVCSAVQENGRVAWHGGGLMIPPTEQSFKFFL